MYRAGLNWSDFDRDRPFWRSPDLSLEPDTDNFVIFQGDQDLVKVALNTIVRISLNLPL